MIQVLIGIALASLGFAGTAGLIPALRDYTYPVIWWGVLPVMDAVNQRWRGQSLWRGRTGWFLGVLLPFSVLFWVFFEILNLPTPQWLYFGAIRSVAIQVAFGFAAFATVIPIVVECWWLSAGPVCLPSLAAFKWPALIAAFVFTCLPFLNDWFWLNQGMWLVPALLILPFLPQGDCGGVAHFGLRLTAAGVLAGLLWEGFNWPSRTHWEYLILRGAPHLFQMPIPGYAGFVPFALSALAAYELASRIRPRVLTMAALWIAAVALLTLMTVVYVRAGLWVFISP
jgi:hypothetical protein